MITDEKIYHVLKDAIINGEFPPGLQLKESTLAEAFGVSRTPIRTVFQRLKYDSLIKLIPNRGAFVYCPHPNEAEQIFFMRGLLEPTAIELAAIHATPKQIEWMEKWLKEESRLIKQRMFLQSLVATKNLHISIVEASGNHYLIEFLNKIITLSHIILTFYDTSEKKEENAAEEHVEIITAIKNKDSKRAKELAQSHIISIQNDIDFSREFTHSVSIHQVISHYIEKP